MFEYELMNVVERINAVDVGEGAGRRAGGVYLKIDTKKGRGGTEREEEWVSGVGSQPYSQRLAISVIPTSFGHLGTSTDSSSCIKNHLILRLLYNRKLQSKCISQ